MAVPAEVVSPLTYDIPIKVISYDGHAVIFQTHRCNNTGSNLTVSVTAFWENRERTLIEVQPKGSGVGNISPGCEDRGGTPVNMDYLPAGTWRLRGSLCTEDICSGWYTDWITR